MHAHIVAESKPSNFRALYSKFTTKLCTVCAVLLCRTFSVMQPILITRIHSNICVFQTKVLQKKLLLALPILAKTPAHSDLPITILITIGDLSQPCRSSLRNALYAHWRHPIMSISDTENYDPPSSYIKFHSLLVAADTANTVIHYLLLVGLKRVNILC